MDRLPRTQFQDILDTVCRLLHKLTRLQHSELSHHPPAAALPPNLSLEHLTRILLAMQKYVSKVSTSSLPPLLDTLNLVQKLYKAQGFGTPDPFKTSG